MSAFRLSESDVEEAARAWLETLGWTVKHGPDIASGELGTERSDYSQVVLTERQQAVLAMLGASAEGLALRDMMTALEDLPQEWQVKEDLALLKRLGLIESRGHGRGAFWLLVRQGLGEVGE